MSKVKVQITMDEDLLKELDDYADSSYMNRSWVISQSVLQWINQKKMVDAVLNMSVAIKKAVDAGTIDQETEKQIKEFEALSRLFIGK